MTGPEETDTLLARAAMADRAAFETLYAETSPCLFGICLRILQDETEAEEVLQDVFAEIWADAEQFRGHELSPDLHLVLAARRAAISLKRARMSAPTEIRTQDLFPHVSLSPEDAPRFGHGDGALTEAIAELPPARAILIERILYNGESYDDLAVAADVDAPTVRRSVQETLSTISQSLDEVGDWSEAETIEGAEIALGLHSDPNNGAGGDETLELQEIWNREIAQVILQNVSVAVPPPQVLRRLKARVFNEPRETLWAQIWPYAVGGALAALLLWFAVSNDLLVAF